MVSLSLLHKRIAQFLFENPKTIEELQKALTPNLSELSKSLQELTSLNLIQKQGFPTKYSINKEIYNEIMKKKAIIERDSFSLRLKIIIESSGQSKEIVEKALDHLEGLLRKQKTSYTIYDVKKAEVIEENDLFYSFIEVELSVKDFRSLVALIIMFAPTSIEIIKPDKVLLSADELQDGLVDVTSMVQSYTTYISKLMSRQEIEKLNQELLRGLVKKQ